MYLDGRVNYIIGGSNPNDVTFVHNKNVVNFHKLAVKERKNVLKGINNTNVDEYMKFNFDGHEFNALPYLVNALTFLYPDNEIITEFYNLVKNDEVDAINSFQEDLEDKKDELLLLKTLLPCIDDGGFRYFVYYEYVKHPTLVARILHHWFESLMFDIIFNKISDNSRLVDNYDIEVCQTSDFCIWVALNWVLSKVRYYKLLLLNTKHMPDFSERLHHFIPTDSLHYKYITGEITIEELEEKYSGLNDEGVSVLDKELYQIQEFDKLSSLKKPLASIKNLKLSKAQKRYNLKYYYSLVLNQDNKIYSQILQAYDVCGNLSSLNSKIKSLKNYNAELEEKNKSLRQDVSDCKKAVTDKDKEIKRLNMALEKAHSTVNKKEKTNEKIVELNKQIKSLKADLNKNHIELNNAVQDQLALRQENSSLKKQLKKLQAYIKNNIPEEENFDVDQVENSEVTFEDAKAYLTDTNIRIAVLGGFKTDFIKRFQKHGVSNVTQFVEMNEFKRVTDKKSYDVGIVCTNDIQHALLYRMNTVFKNIPMIYTTTTNIELLIKEIYDELKED